MENDRVIDKSKDDEVLARIETETAEGECVVLDSTQTHRGLKSRHSQMIALGGTIGTGLFVGSGQALRIGGPGLLLAAYITLSIFVFGIVTATTELSSYLCLPGSTIPYFGYRFFSRSMGFALGWMYWYFCVITVPAEITASSLVIDYWNPPSSINVGVWITIMIVVIVALNFCSVSVYGETEFWFASIKVFGIVGLLLMAIVITSGGAPSGNVIGFTYWNNPGAANEYLTTGGAGKLCAYIGATCFSGFAFLFAPELLVITSGEMKDPRINIPKAGKRYIIRVVVFYVLGAFFMGMIIPSNDPQLLGGGSGAGASPWAIAAKNAGIKGLDSVINAVILLSAWSSGNAFLYMASRSLYSMAVFGTAPAIFKRCTRSGVPYVAIGLSAVFSLLSFLNCSNAGAEVFNWLVNLVNCTGFLSWIIVCCIYLRFRKATFAQNVTRLPYRSILQPYASYACMVVFSLTLLLNGFANFFPGHWDTANFITSYFGLLLFAVLYLGHKFLADRNAPWLIPVMSVDLHTGIAELEAAERLAPEPKTYRWYFLWRRLIE